MSSSQFAAAGATIVLAACGGAAVFALTAGPHATSGRTVTAARMPVAAVQPQATQPSATSDAKQVYEGAKESVAQIQAVTSEGQSTGTGFVVSADGLIVTNGHVVDGAQEVTVQLGTDGTQRTAQVVGGDADQDLAVLKVDTTGRRAHAAAPLDERRLRRRHRLRDRQPVRALADVHERDRLGDRA